MKKIKIKKSRTIPTTLRFESINEGLELEVEVPEDFTGIETTLMKRLCEYDLFMELLITFYFSGQFPRNKMFKEIEDYEENFIKETKKVLNAIDMIIFTASELFRVIDSEMFKLAHI